MEAPIKQHSFVSDDFALVSQCFHFFGTSMYFLGAYLRNWSDIDATPSAFWGGFVVANGVWWLIPLLLIIGGVVAVSSKLSATKSSGGSKRKAE